MRGGNVSSQQPSCDAEAKPHDRDSKVRGALVTLLHFESALGTKLWASSEKMMSRVFKLLLACISFSLCQIHPNRHRHLDHQPASSVSKGWHSLGASCMLKVSQHPVEESTQRWKACMELDVVMHNCNPSTLGTGAGRSGVQGYPGLHKYNSNKKPHKKSRPVVLGSVTVPGGRLGDVFQKSEGVGDDVRGPSHRCGSARLFSLIEWISS